jgi:AcrR family transcriptional regulator
MSVDDRRAALIEATIPLLEQKGRAASTREIAAAAGIAEGTIFRVFESKDHLIGACIHQASDTARVRGELAHIDPSRPLPERLTAAVGVMQSHLRGLFALMTMLHSTGQPLRRPPADEHERARRRSSQEIDQDFFALIGADASLLRVPVQRLVDTLRMLTLSSVHPMMGGREMPPEDIVDIVLRGALADRPPSTETSTVAAREASCSSD